MTNLIAYIQLYCCERAQWFCTFYNICFLFQIKGTNPKVLEGGNYTKYALQLARRGGAFSYYREITQTFRLAPGTYVVIPATFDANVEMDFLLRMYTEKDVKSLWVGCIDTNLNEVFNLLWENIIYNNGNYNSL